MLLPSNVTSVTGCEGGWGAVTPFCIHRSVTHTVKPIPPSYKPYSHLINQPQSATNNQHSANTNHSPPTHSNNPHYNHRNHRHTTHRPDPPQKGYFADKVTLAFSYVAKHDSLQTAPKPDSEGKEKAPRSSDEGLIRS
jgi:hypothetical protein